MKYFKFLLQILKLPKVSIKFTGKSTDNLNNYNKTYKYFTKLHRLKIFKNKTIGVALLDLHSFSNFDEYYKYINGKNSAAYYSRKCTKRKYQFQVIDRNKYIDDIDSINTSAVVRQGKTMSSAYLHKQQSYKNQKNYRYFGVVNSYGSLVSYCNIGFYGEFSVVVTLLGNKEFLNDGVMYLMMTELHKLMFVEYKKDGYKYVMYDTFFGASAGLKMFKTKLGFKPYRVKWLWEN